MAMDITIHSAKSVDETVALVAVQINDLRLRFGERFWFSRVMEATKLSREVMEEEFGFAKVSGFSVRDNSKEFDGLDEVARALRAAIGRDDALVTYSDTGKPFPANDYVDFLIAIAEQNSSVS